MKEGGSKASGKNKPTPATLEEIDKELMALIEGGGVSGR